MATTHKLSGAHISVSSVAPADRLLKVAEEAAEATRGIGMHKGAKIRVRVGERGDDWIAFEVAYKRTVYLTFDVRTAMSDDGDGRTLLSSEITSFTKTQDMFLIFIPMGPKKLDGYHFYKQFMLELEDRMRRREPSVRVEIIEQGAQR